VARTRKQRVKFQPTHPHGVRQRTRPKVVMSVVFQPTHPHGVRLVYHSRRGRSISCFNPRTRTGCDCRRCASGILVQVSTHAPARGATRQQGCGSCVTTFQPTHPHGVRQAFAGISGKQFKFQPTHPHGVRRHSLCIFVLLNSFNPRTRTGCDPVLGSAQRVRSKFQPTHPHGVRHTSFRG